MKILSIANKLPYPPRDGGAIGVLNTATGLSEAGNAVTIFAVNTKKHAYDPGDIPEEITSKVSFVTVDADTSIRSWDMLANLLFSRKPYIAARFHLPEVHSALVSHLEENEYDIIQFEGPYLGIYLPEVRRLSKAKIVFRSHNVEYEIWQRHAKNERNLLKRWYMGVLHRRIRKFEIAVMQGCDLMVTVSERDEAILRSHHFNRPSITIPSGINVRDYRCRMVPAGRKICFIGALDWMPNQEGLLWFIDHVLRDLADELPDVELHIAGRNAPPDLEKKLKVANVVYHGEVEDAHQFLGISHILIAPLLSGSGIRIKILEGMALCKAVVTSGIGAEGIHAEHQRNLLIADDARAFKEQLAFLLKNPDKAESIARNARKLIQEKFDTFALCSRLTEFYKEMA